MSDTNKL